MKSLTYKIEAKWPGGFWLKFVLPDANIIYDGMTMPQLTAIKLLVLEEMCSK